MYLKHLYSKISALEESIEIENAADRLLCILSLILPISLSLSISIPHSLSLSHFVCLHASISFTFPVFASFAFCTRHRTQLIYHLQVGTPSLAPHCCMLSCRVAASPTPRLFHLVPGSTSITTPCYLSALYCQNALSKQMLNNFSAAHTNTPCPCICICICV